MKIILLFTFTFFSIFFYAQKDSTTISKDSIKKSIDTVKLAEKDIKVSSIPKKNWSIKARNSILLNQSSFSNWIGGGANNIGWISSVDYNLTFEDDWNLWENILLSKYGQNKTEGIGNRKTQDELNFSTNYGRKISENWFISAGTSLQTQFAAGYKNGNNPEADKISNFMAPGYINFGAGFTYRKGKNFTMTLRPANIRWTLVLDKDLQKAGNYGLESDGDRSLIQFGFFGTAMYKVKLMEDIYLTSNASVISDYLNHPERLVLIYGGRLDLKLNKYISTILTLDLIYDHNQIQKLQTKQTVGVGLSYEIEKGKKRSEDKFHRAWR